MLILVNKNNLVKYCDYDESHNPCKFDDSGDFCNSDEFVNLVYLVNLVVC